MVGASPGALRPKREVAPEGPLTSLGMAEGEGEELDAGRRLAGSLRWLKSGRNEGP
jgi:hypothetical protein